jgi:hypothetical protein
MYCAIYGAAIRSRQVVISLCRMDALGHADMTLTSLRQRDKTAPLLRADDGAAVQKILNASGRGNARQRDLKGEDKTNIKRTDYMVRLR